MFSKHTTVAHREGKGVVLGRGWCIKDEKKKMIRCLQGVEVPNQALQSTQFNLRPNNPDLKVGDIRHLKKRFNA